METIIRENNKSVTTHSKVVIAGNPIGYLCVFLCKLCQCDTLLFNCFLVGSSVHLWSQLKEVEQLLKGQRDLGTDESERS